MARSGSISAIWFARAVSADEHVTTMEVDETYPALARDNLDRAEVTDRVRLAVGPAAESVRALIDANEDPFDVILIDADKPNNPIYLEAALTLSRPATVIIGDNVVRDGAVTDPESEDPRVHGSRALIEAIGRDANLSATALQTVGLKGWDGFPIAVFR